MWPPLLLSGKYSIVEYQWISHNKTKHNITNIFAVCALPTAFSACWCCRSMRCASFAAHGLSAICCVAWCRSSSTATSACLCSASPWSRSIGKHHPLVYAALTQHQLTISSIRTQLHHDNASQCVRAHLQEALDHRHDPVLLAAVVRHAAAHAVLTLG